LHVTAALKNNKGDFFLRGDVQSQQVTLGCHHMHCKRHHHAIEATYDVSKKTEGIRSLPLTLRWAGVYELTDNITWKSKLEAGKEVTLENAWIQKVDDRVKITASDYTNLTHLIFEPKAANINFGLAVTLTL